MHRLLEFDSILYCLFKGGNPVLIGSSELCMKMGECAIRDHHSQSMRENVKISSQR